MAAERRRLGRVSVFSGRVFRVPSRQEAGAHKGLLKAKGYLTLRVPARAVRETPAVCLEKIEGLLTANTHS